MNRRSFALGALAASVLGGLPLAACRAEGLPTYRYRLTVEVDTPQGLRSGSSVIEVSTTYINQQGLPEKPNHIVTRSRGEAVAVDLPGGQTLFALLRSHSEVDAAGGYAWALFDGPHAGGPDGFFVDLKRLVTMRGRVATIPRDWPNPPPWVTRKLGDPPSAWPMLVRFKDLRDPKSVEAVDAEHLDRSFGPGMQLRRISVELTDDPVTTGIEKRLVWLGNLKKYRTDPTHPFTSTLPPEIGGLRAM